VIGLANELTMRNLEARRDWGHARDYIRVMWLMLQQGQSDDYVAATGETHSVREFAEKAFGYIRLDCKKYVTLDEKLFRPAEVDVLQGDASKAKNTLGWKHIYNFDQLVKEMVEEDTKLVSAKNSSVTQNFSS
jgi:GDPmannose 4,6-dehydratase